jgi:hypothetical protein
VSAIVLPTGGSSGKGRRVSGFYHFSHSEHSPGTFKELW